MTGADSDPGPLLDEPALAPFRAALLGWFDRVARPMPWRSTRDPYRVWLSEVMLQQTRVDQALPYYERFLERFPNVRALASASLDDVLRLWEGLGYYSRARNLHRAAGEIVSRFAGALPADPATLRSLPGVGDYTAAAVASLAFGAREAAVDGNVIRVVSRLFADVADPAKALGRRRLRERAALLLDPDRPGAWNEAMMELGATVCTPRSPSCDACPVRPHCEGFRSGDPTAYPARRRRPAVPHYDVAVGIVRRADGRLLIQRRPEEAMLGGLWEFPGGKCESGERPESACRRELLEELGIEVDVGERMAEIAHSYSHFRVTLHAFPCTVRDGDPTSVDGRTVAWVAREELADYAFPRANRRLIERLASGEDG
jgi:A/G-specific adenine glycosylase